MGGMTFGMPDVCKTPIPPAPVIPIPYPNTTMGMMGVPAVYNCFVSGTPAHTMMTTIPMSNGDNPGVTGGVASQIVMGPSRHMIGSFTCLIGCMPATKLTSMSAHNGMAPNVPGMSIVPSQFQCVIMT